MPVYSQWQKAQLPGMLVGMDSWFHNLPSMHVIAALHFSKTCLVCRATATLHAKMDKLQQQVRQQKSCKLHNKLILPVTEASNLLSETIQIIRHDR